MARIKVKPPDIEPRPGEEVLSGGTKQDRARDLFRALIPSGDTLYTAAEVVKLSFPGVKPGTDLYKVYQAQYNSLNRLVRQSEIYDSPDNADATGRRPPGKGKKSDSQQPRRWNRESWLKIISDEIYAWLIKFKAQLIALEKTHHPGTILWCELETLKVTAEEPADIPGDLGCWDVNDAELVEACRPRLATWELYESEPEEEEPANQAAEEEAAEGEPLTHWRRLAADPRVRAAVTLAAVLILAFLWPRSTNDGPAFIFPELNDIPAELAAIEEDDYLVYRRRKNERSFSAPLTDERIAGNWKATPPQAEMLAKAPPPPLFGPTATRRPRSLVLAHLSQEQREESPRFPFPF